MLEKILFIIDKNNLDNPPDFTENLKYTALFCEKLKRSEKDGTDQYN